MGNKSEPRKAYLQEITLVQQIAEYHPFLLPQKAKTKNKKKPIRNDNKKIRSPTNDNSIFSFVQ